jgi:hypothetical protein
MKATDSIIAEFIKLHDRYKKADERMLLLQSTSIEGMRKIGVGCVNEKSKAEFAALKKEIESVLSRMKEICLALD